MSRKGGHANPRAERTVAYLLRCPRSTVPEAMRASKFSLDESRDAAKQIAVRRAYGKASGGKAKLPPSVQRDHRRGWAVLVAALRSIARSIDVVEVYRMHERGRVRVGARHGTEGGDAGGRSGFVVFCGNAHASSTATTTSTSGSFQTWGEDRGMRFAAVPFHRRTVEPIGNDGES